MATQITPASSPWLQLCIVMAGQSSSLCSVPTHPTLSNRIWPLPAPKKARDLATALKVEKPSCLHTTLASGMPHSSSQTVPQVLPMQSSTRPSLVLLPPTSLRSPWTQPWHLIPASSRWTQLSMVRWRQLRRLASVPIHWTLSM